MIKFQKTLIATFFLALKCYSQKVFRPIPVAYTYETQYPNKEVKESSICIPLAFKAPDLSKIETELCDFYSGRHVDEGWESILLPYRVEVDYEVWRQRPLDELKLQKNVFSISEKIYYWADGTVFTPYLAPISGQCGWDDESAREVVIGYDSKLSFSESYYLKSITQTRPVKNSNRCELTVLKKDVTENLNKMIAKFMNKGGEIFDNKLKELTTFKQKAQIVWDYLQKPIKIDSRSWLYLDLRKVSGGDILATDETPQVINTSIGLNAFPKIYYGSMPTTQYRPLPRLKVETCNPGIEAVPEFIMSFDSLNSILNTKETGLVDNPQYYKRKKITVKHVDCYSNNGKLVIATKLELRAYKPKVKKAKLWNSIKYFFEKIFYRVDGTVYTTGMPSFDTMTNNVHLKGLDYDIATRSILAKAAKWIFDSKIREFLMQKAQYNIKSEIDAFKINLIQQLNQKISSGITLKGDINKLTPDIVFLYNDKIIVRFALSANATLDIAKEN